jgi:Tripartite tricarboxylate transporter TctB family
MAPGGGASRSDLLGGVAWMLFGGLILAASWRMDRFESMGAMIYTAPGFVPAMFGFSLVLLGALLAWRGWRTRPVGDAAPGEALLNRRVGVTLLLTLLYAAVLVGRWPFWLATALFVATFTGLYADTLPPARRALTAVMAGVLTTLAVVLVFERLFLVRLP